MDPFTLAQIGIPIVTGIMGQQAAAGSRSAAEEDLKAIAGAYNIPLPELERMRLNLEEQQLVGTLAPQMEAAQTVGDTALANIALDPRYNEYTMSALQKMAQVQEQGLPEVDRAQLNQILNAAARQGQAQQEAILEGQAARGMAGSGNELAAQLAASQAGSNQASQNAMQLAALAAQRKLDATSGLSNMVQNVQNADYQRQAALQGQRDAIAQFNAQQQAASQMRNIAAQNLAQQQNLQTAQNVANQNVATRNAQQQYNRNLYQQQFDNQMRRAGGMVGARATSMAGNQSAANATAGMYGQIGAGLTGVLGNKDVQSGLTGLFSKQKTGLESIGDGKADALSDDMTNKLLNPFNS